MVKKGYKIEITFRNGKPTYAKFNNKRIAIIKPFDNYEIHPTISEGCFFEFRVPPSIVHKKYHKVMYWFPKDVKPGAEITYTYKD